MEPRSPRSGTFRERTVGESKVTSQVYVEYLRHLLRLRLDSLPIGLHALRPRGLTGVFVDMGVLTC